jgi:hypothetical protein
MTAGKVAAVRRLDLSEATHNSRPVRLSGVGK